MTVEVSLSSDAQVAWLAIAGATGQAISLDFVAARIAYRAGRDMEPPPTEKDAWSTRARAAVSELLLQEFIKPEPSQNPEEEPRYRVTTEAGRVPDLRPYGVKALRRRGL